uniref:glutamic acid-rich protein-like isoform X2 n=1 Tax=Fragaria vesca subsp. vesca TaxID=101020 RepID=UPI0005CA1776|nr:PREDICTED: glutamic acid-rich protein-like isoform X2 [Fragaria vesca subsp. vesca]
METPSSTRRVTRSQTQNNNTIPISRKNNEDSEMGVSKSRTRNGKNQQQQDRSALIDITNDSPIVGVAMQTPSSAIIKLRSLRAKTTPGSGEALLRGQVKTLLQQVEEEAEVSKLSFENRPFRHLQSLIGNSPTGLLAPTPANTPQVYDLLADGSGSNIERPSPMVQEQLISQVVCDIFEGKNQASLESQKSILSRSLLLDFSEKSEISFSEEEDCSSVITSESKERSSPDDDSASLWSIQVNASTRDEEEDEEEEEEEEEYNLKGVDETEEEEENEEDAGYDVDELCEGISKIFVDEKRMIPKFEGKRTKFVYNSDDEIVEEVVEDNTPRTPDSADVVSPSVLCLKGLPTPKGKHLRFLDEDDYEYSS